MACFDTALEDFAMMQWVFGLMILFSLLYASLLSQGENVAQGMLVAAGDAVTFSIQMAGGFAFFCGMANILRASGAVNRLSKLFSPVLRFLLGPDLSPDAMEYAVLNLTCNALGLGNAATPLGVEAAKRMAVHGDAAGNALCMFLVINSSSVQLLPTTVISLRAAAGSKAPGAIALPALFATAVSTLVGILSCKLLEKRC